MRTHRLRHPHSADLPAALSVAAVTLATRVMKVRSEP